MLSTRSRNLLVAVLSTFFATTVLSTPLQAGLVFDWSFGNTNPMGPVTGTISFNAVTPGAGGTSLTPDSIVITSAPGHIFTSGYVVGTEVIGSPMGALINLPSFPAWSIDANDQIIGGGAAFIAAASGNADQLVLEVLDAMDGDEEFSFLNSSAGITSATDLTFSAVPEPGSFGLLGLIGACLAYRRRRRFWNL